MGTSDQERRELGARMKLARGHAGLSQSQVARELGLHRPAVSEMEAGRRGVGAGELKVLARLYGVSVDWLVRSEDEGLSPHAELAARRLSKLSAEDLDSVLAVIRAARGRTDG
ncbi:MAG: helix-turn-helix transcriptional regulator [Proteobacteria bacterium]|nr:helix-turn-helix transcriptional regulator [Pseudomonadota bacterium]MCP4920699.1 helix-turn-helix transcriptional regulator [Pseudomonadota bacterium]